MTGLLSIQEVVASLKKRAAFHRERMAEHAEKEAFHRELRSKHETELATITSRLEGFLTAAAAAVEIVAQGDAPEKAAEEEVDYGSASRPKLTKMVRAVLAGIGPHEPFGPNGVLAEVERRFGSGLRRRPDLRQISDVLRRLGRTGRIHRLRNGIPHHESRYVQRLEAKSS